MRKVYYYIVLVLLMFIPLGVKAEAGIGKFYMDATINSDGSVLVKEAFTMNGEYNGFDRIIKYRNNEVPDFNVNNDKYGGTSLHNGSNIYINKVMGINSDFFDTKDFNSVTGDLFNSGIGSSSYGNYSETNYPDGKNLRIYNSSSSGKDFYLEYIISDLAILHNDIGEIGWNIFGDELNETIKEFYLKIHIPNNQKELRAWAHGPLNGNIDIIDKQTVIVTINNLSHNTAFDVRLAFDRDVVKNSLKVNQADVLSKIVNYEQEKADIANKERQMAKIKYYAVVGISIAWIIGLIGFIIYIYLKCDKEYKSSFNVKYYRDFPNTYNPEIVGYLFNKKVGTNDLSASIMNLIYKKVIRVEEIPSEKKKDYKFIYNREDFNDQTGLNEPEQNLVGWLFNGQKEVTLSAFQKEAKSEYNSFLSSYNIWNNLAVAEAQKYNFFESKGKVTTASLYTIIGMILLTILNMKVGGALLAVIIFILGFIAIIYFVTLTKRTIFGNDEYVKWKAFKNFLVDFGNFSDKELPEITLWEKYLVYAVTLGCATKLAKTMEIKARELYPNGYDGYYYNHDFYYYVALNRTINSGVNDAINTAISTKSAATSSSSSGFGSGGGFSSGGGSFGGGGGGGRF